jgi:hypothetical protein
MHMPLPLAKRSATELQAKADELLGMSETARTEDTRDALRRLAYRFAKLAKDRNVDDVGPCAKTGSWTMLRPAGTAASGR